MKKLPKNLNSIPISVYLSEKELERLDKLRSCILYENAKKEKKTLKRSQLLRHLVNFITSDQNRYLEFTNYLEVDPNLQTFEWEFENVDEQDLLLIYRFLETTINDYNQLLKKVFYKENDIE